jgi:hypothetical protein
MAAGAAMFHLWPSAPKLRRPVFQYLGHASKSLELSSKLATIGEVLIYCLVRRRLSSKKRELSATSARNLKSYDNSEIASDNEKLNSAAGVASWIICSR